MGSKLEMCQNLITNFYKILNDLFNNLDSEADDNESICMNEYQSKDLNDSFTEKTKTYFRENFRKFIHTANALKFKIKQKTVQPQIQFLREIFGIIKNSNYFVQSIKDQIEKKLKKLQLNSTHHLQKLGQVSEDHLSYVRDKIIDCLRANEQNFVPASLSRKTSKNNKLNFGSRTGIEEIKGELVEFFRKLGKNFKLDREFDLNRMKRERDLLLSLIVKEKKSYELKIKNTFYP